jgi:hypothetical protein
MRSFICASQDARADHLRMQLFGTMLGQLRSPNRTTSADKAGSKQVSQTGSEEEQKSAAMPQTLRRAGDVLRKTRVQLYPGTPSERDERRGGVRLQSSRFLCRMVTRPHVKASS